MRKLTSSLVIHAFTLALLGAHAVSARAQLRVVDYNTAGVSNAASMQTVLAALNNESVNGITKPVDVLILQELSSGDMAAMLNMMNGLGAGTYVASNVGGTTGAGGVGLIYRQQSVDLIEQQQIIAPNTNGAERGVMRFILRPDGYDSAANFYIYNSHYKASDTSADRAQRNQEAGAIRVNSDALGDGAHVIYAGDFNIYRSSEPMWATLTAAGNGQAFDPVNQVGSWHDSSSFIGVHTQNPAGAGFVGGGMDDRFDWQMVTGELMDNEGMSIMSGSYHAFGNNGTHSINGHINSGTGASPAVLNALGSASDHLPVVAQYQVPAKMSVAVSEVPAQVLVGASLSATVDVANSAGDGVVVVATNGADELDYTVAASGAASGIVSGTDAAFGGANDHAFALDTATAGNKSADFAATATSPQVPNPLQSLSRDYTVLDHATPSFDGLNELASLSYDFGTVAQGGTDPIFSFDIHNLVSTLDFTADLDFDSFLATGDVAAFNSSDFAAAAGSLSLAAGASQAFNVFFDTAAVGSFSATYSLMFTDQDLPGALATQLLLTVTGDVIAVPEPAAWLLAIWGCGILGMRRTR